jgi:hypothetical protein
LPLDQKMWLRHPCLLRVIEFEGQVEVFALETFGLLWSTPGYGAWGISMPCLALVWRFFNQLFCGLEAVPYTCPLPHSAHHSGMHHGSQKHLLPTHFGQQLPGWFKQMLALHWGQRFHSSQHHGSGWNRVRQDTPRTF